MVPASYDSGVEVVGRLGYVAGDDDEGLSFV